MSANSIASHDNGKASTTRDALLQKFGSDVDLLALGSSVSRVVQLASADDEATRTLAYGILSDVALTQKILRLANTVFYRTASSTPVTTISRAIFLLGFDTVKTSALAMMLIDGLASNKHAQSVRRELTEALCASLVGREMARRSQYQGAEEASIAALFKNLGRLLLASHEHSLYKEIVELSVAGGHTLAQASMQVLGCSFELLSESVLHKWDIPDTIIHSLRPIPPGIVPAHKNRQEWMRQVAAFSVEAAQQVMCKGDPVSSDASQALLKRYGSALYLDQDKLTHLFATVSHEIEQLVESLNLAGPQKIVIEAPVEEEKGLPSILQLATMDAGATQTDTRHASGKPVNARDLLLAGVQDATQMMASGRCKVNELILLVLEILYNSMGFRFATVCLKDPKTAKYRSRIAIGEDHAARQAEFVFPLASARDLFHLAMENNADLMIADAATPKIRELLPAWHRALLPDARSFIVLPLVLQKVQIGLFYADRAQTAPEGVPPDEAALIKALMGQVLAALNAR